MKLWGSVRQGAAKVAFEADKMVRVRKQEQAIAEVEKQVREHFISLGESVLDLYRKGMVDHPTIAAAHQQMSALEQQVAQLQHELELIKTEEYEPEAPVGADASVIESSGQPAAPAAPVAAAAPIQPVAQSAPEPAPAAEVRHCTNCGATLPEKGAFCPECGQPVKTAE